MEQLIHASEARNFYALISEERKNELIIAMNEEIKFQMRKEHQYALLPPNMTNEETSWLIGQLLKSGYATANNPLRAIWWQHEFISTMTTVE